MSADADDETAEVILFRRGGHHFDTLGIRLLRGRAFTEYDSATTTPSAAFQTAVQNMVLYGGPTAGASPVVPNLTAGNTNLTVAFTNGVPSAMTVSISGYTIKSIVATTTPIFTSCPSGTSPFLG